MSQFIRLTDLPYAPDLGWRLGEIYIPMASIVAGLRGPQGPQGEPADPAVLDDLQTQISAIYDAGGGNAALQNATYTDGVLAYTGGAINGYPAMTMTFPLSVAAGGVLTMPTGGSGWLLYVAVISGSQLPMSLPALAMTVSVGSVGIYDTTYAVAPGTAVPLQWTDHSISAQIGGEWRTLSDAPLADPHVLLFEVSGGALAPVPIAVTGLVAGSGGGLLLQEIEDRHAADAALSGQMASKASQTALDALAGTVADVQTLAQVNQLNIAGKADQIDVDALQTTVTGQGLTLAQKADQTALDALATVVSGKATPADISAAIAALVGGAPAALDTLAELATALAGEQAQIADLLTALSLRVRVDAMQSLTLAQQLQARQNIGAEASGAAAADASNNSIAIGGVSSRVVRIEQETAEYTGTADLVPLITDTGNKVILGVYRSSGAMYVSGALTESIVPEMLGRQSEMQFIGTGNVVPFVTDINNKVVLGFDRSTSRLIGAGLDSAVQASATPQPLPTAIVPKAINHLLFYGQSLSVGAVAGSVLSTTQPYSNVTFNGGPRAWSGSAWDFGTFKPLVEDAVSPAPDGGTNRAETACSGAANYASTTMARRGVNPASHVILCSTAGHGGYRIDQLYKTSAWYSNLLAHVSGARAQTTDHAVHAVGWIQGENDVTATTSYATYRSRLEQLQVDMETDIRAITTQTHPVYLLSYQCSWGTKTFKDIALAQLDLCQKNSKFFLTTPTYHLPYAGDNIHLTAVGYKWMGAYFGRAYAALVRGERPQWLNPVSATLRGAELRVRFDVPQLPLVLDDVTLAATTNYGFAVLDGVAAATVSAIKTDGRDVVITLASVPTGAVTVRYALDYLGAGLAIGNGASGNLRDSTTDTISISSVSRPLYHVAPAFELAAIKLGE